ncbi:MAG: hypothetical protein HY367_01575 [Candidatus Aenigmarchaeota archaeon]|nr:hypothetical protein [Candidatus Aenigmarchaeota archaeon]
MSLKLVVIWIIGGLLLAAGTWIISNLEFPRIGVTETQFTIGLVIGLVLYLMAGLAWISVAVATRSGHE